MVAVVEDSPDILEGMANPKKPTGGKHKTHRINVGVPEDWHAVLRKLAAKRQQPVVYLIISLAAAEASRLKLPDLPPTPWEADDT